MRSEAEASAKSPQKDEDSQKSNEEQKPQKGSENISKEQESESIIAFDSLNTAEKDALIKKLRRDILKEEEPSYNFCFSFFNWIFEQFSINKTRPIPPVLMSNLEYLGENAETKGIFVEHGNEELQKLYYESMVQSVELNYKKDEIDVCSLACAVLEYIKDEVSFIDSLIYVQMATAYKTGEEKNYRCRRLPFVLENRTLFSAILCLVRTIEKKSAENQVENEKVIELFSDSVFSWEREDTEDPLSPSMKKELFDDLMKVDFDLVPFEFYK